jgi:hypothetical protein
MQNKLILSHIFFITGSPFLSPAFIQAFDALAAFDQGLKAVDYAFYLTPAVA